MAINKITEKTTSNALKADAHVLVTQTETVNGSDVHALRRVPIAKFEEHSALVFADDGDGNITIS